MDPSHSADSNVQPIHYAARAGNVETVQLLLDAGADPEARTQHGMRALHYAVSMRSKEACEALIGAGVDVGARTTGRLGASQFFAISRACGDIVLWKEWLLWLEARGVAGVEEQWERVEERRRRRVEYGV